eukprot:5251489-Amphidinium_carterae.2
MDPTIVLEIASSQAAQRPPKQTHRSVALPKHQPTLGKPSPGPRTYGNNSQQHALTLDRLSQEMQFKLGIRSRFSMLLRAKGNFKLD